jgi:hypothetical protein
VISSQERRIWQDNGRQPIAVIDLRVLPDTHQHDRQLHEVRSVDDVPAVIATGIWIGITLILFGVVRAGVVLIGVAVLLAVVWRYWPLLRGPLTLRRRARAADGRLTPRS